MRWPSCVRDVHPVGPPASIDPLPRPSGSLHLRSAGPVGVISKLAAVPLSSVVVLLLSFVADLGDATARSRASQELDDARHADRVLLVSDLSRSRSIGSSSSFLLALRTHTEREEHRGTSADEARATISGTSSEQSPPRVRTMVDARRLFREIKTMLCQHHLTTAGDFSCTR